MDVVVEKQQHPFTYWKGAAAKSAHEALDRTTSYAGPGRAARADRRGCECDQPGAISQCNAEDKAQHDPRDECGDHVKRNPDRQVTIQSKTDLPSSCRSLKHPYQAPACWAA